MVRTEVHLSIGGMSGPYLVEPQPSEMYESGKRVTCKQSTLKSLIV